jgi:hypothetical protein
MWVGVGVVVVGVICAVFISKRDSQRSGSISESLVPRSGGGGMGDVAAVGKAASTADGIAVSLDDIQRTVQVNIAADDMNLRLMQYEKELRDQLAGGWKPPWSALEIKASDEELQRMSTRDLAGSLLASGIPEHEMLVVRDPNFALKRLELLHKGYGELLAREDLWETMASGIEFSSNQLDRNAKFVDNARILSGLKKVANLYSYPPIKKQIMGHEKDFIKAHIAALSSIGQFYKDVDERDIHMGDNYNYLKFAGTASTLADVALGMASKVDLPRAERARSSIPALTPDTKKLPSRGEVIQYIDRATTELQRFVK